MFIMFCQQCRGEFCPEVHHDLPYLPYLQYLPYLSFVLSFPPPTLAAFSPSLYTLLSMPDHGFRIRTLSERNAPAPHDPPEESRNRSTKEEMRWSPSFLSRFFKRPRANRSLLERLKALWFSFLSLYERIGARGLILRAGGALFGLLALYLLFIWFTLPDISDPRNLIAAPAQSSVITDRNGVELYRLFEEEDRTIIPGDQIPKHMKQAIIAIEDERFYDRGCIDIRAVGRALFRFGQRGGASTLTRQLARNALNLKRSNLINRKVKELILGCKLETAYDKETIVELYLNWIPFGQNAYGVEQASKKYFGTSAKELTLAEAAVLAALPQRPTYFSPYGSHVRTTVADTVTESIAQGKTKKISDIPEEKIVIGLLGQNIGTGGSVFYIGGRSDQVLKNMQEQGFITEQERLKALDDLAKITFQPARENIRAAHFVLWVREQVETMYRETAEEGILERGGLVIETTLDWDLQQAAEKAVDFHKQDLLDRFGAHNIALVALDPQSREIRAYVGNADYSDQEHGGKVDMARAPRAPGSSFKPFVYAAAFLQGYGPATVLYDVPTKFGEDEPQNYDGAFWGLVNIRKALGASRNIPAIKAYFLAGGEDPILELAARMGAPTPQARKQELIEERGTFDYGWPLALGAGETPLLEMVQGYATLGGGGSVRPVTSIRQIKDRNGALLFEREKEETQEDGEVLDPRIAYQLTSILSDVSARPQEFWKTVLSVPGFATAAKTGTSNKCLERNEKDGVCRLRKPDNVWTIGYTPMLVAGVWVGNADSSSLYEKADGLTVAAPLWRDFMIGAHKKMKITQTEFPVPGGLVSPQISLLSGELPTECTPVDLRRADLFRSEVAPKENDPACLQLTIDKVTGLLASEECPVEAQETASFWMPRSVLADRWPLWQVGIDAWAAKEMVKWNAAPDHSGSILPLPVAPTEECKISLTPGRMEKPEVRIDYPSQGDTVSYPSFQPELDWDVSSSVREIIFEVDGKVIDHMVERPFKGFIRVPRSIKEDGPHRLKVTLIDEYYNQATDEVNFVFGKDESGPSVRITAPAQGYTLRKGEEISIRAEAEDQGGIKHVQFYLDDILLSTKPKEPFELTYPMVTSPGPHTIRAVATDSTGNTEEDAVEITVEE